MRFNDLLRSQGIAPKSVALALHKPSRLSERRAIYALAETKPDLFNAYQSTHSDIQERTLKAREVMASFIPGTTGEFIFVGLYRQAGWVEASPDALNSDPVFAEMLRLIGDRPASDDFLGGRARFDLQRMPELTDLSGRLVVSDPMARNYMRLAENTELEIVEVVRQPRYVPEMPAWDQLVLTKEDLQTLPSDWRSRLSEWRGIYLIVDQSNGARYVGAAYGEDNLFGRWMQHVASEYGVTVELSKRRTEGFRFSILQLLAPTASVEEVTAAEQSWMLRLDTKTNGLNA